MELVRGRGGGGGGTNQGNSSAQTGKEQPNMSTTFIGKSTPEVLACNEIPRSADPVLGVSCAVEGREREGTNRVNEGSPRSQATQS